MRASELNLHTRFFSLAIDIGECNPKSSFAGSIINYLSDFHEENKTQKSCQGGLSAKLFKREENKNKHENSAL
jgi:hypothetical protein